MSAPTEPLKPCPFCGYRQTWGNRYTPEDIGWWCVQCPSCDGAGPLEETEAEAIAAWNRRSPSTPEED